jgi:hypothetical protein
MVDFSLSTILIFGAVLVIITIISIVLWRVVQNDDTALSTTDFHLEDKYTHQVKLLSDKYNPLSSGKRPVTELVGSDTTIPESEQCLVNFYGLSCRFTGYIGPFNEGYFDPDIAVQLAVNAGVRTFILEIDYLDECNSETIKYYPRLVVRDSQGKMRIKYNSNRPICNSDLHSNLREVCEKINFYAYSQATQNSTDPVIIVLYFLRQPPGSYKSKTVLDYYSNVAKALAPFKDRLLTNELLGGGTFYRQKQESKLLINKITDYNNKVLIFSNANTSGFREVQTYSPSEDLDFLTNLCLGYSQTRLGITNEPSNAHFGILETVQDYLIIPTDRTEDVVESTKLKYTICLNTDPSVPVTKDNYNKITSQYGINAVPIQLFDSTNDFMFTDDTFKKYSFIPKPHDLRYVKPPVVVPGEANPNTDAKGGALRMPSI